MTPPVSEIETMDRAALIAAWDEVFGTPVPKRLSSPFLRRYLAFEMQAQERGGLPKGFVGKLQKADRDDRGTSSAALKPAVERDRYAVINTLSRVGSFGRIIALRRCRRSHALSPGPGGPSRASSA